MDDLTSSQAPADLQQRLHALGFAQAMVRGRDGTILFWARGMERLYGFSAAEALGQSSQTLLRTAFPRPLPDIEAELTERGEWSGEVVHHRRDGQHRTV